MHRLRATLTAALLAGLGVVATPGTALADSCDGFHGFRYGGVPLSFEYFATMDCTVAMTQITLVLRLYRHDPLSGSDVLVSTGANTTTGSSHGEAATSPPLCIPGSYTGEVDYTVVYPNGSGSSDSRTYGPATVVCGV